MTEQFQTDNRELDDLFERYRAAPGSHIFAPLADACRKAGMLEEALEICARGVGSHPRYASGYVVQGKCLYDSGRVADALAAFERVLILDPKNLVALKYLGILYAERGESARASEYFEHILALDPDNREIRSRIEDVELALPHVPHASGRAEAEALADVVDAVERDDAVGEDEEIAVLPDMEDDAFEGEPITLGDETEMSDEIATMTLADIYAAQGYGSRALKIYREVQKRQPDNAALASKINVLERNVRAAIDAARTSEPARPVATNVAEKATPTPAPKTPESPASEPTVQRPSALPSGTPINQSQSYEQFKRWLKASR